MAAQTEPRVLCAFLVDRTKGRRESQRKAILRAPCLDEQLRITEVRGFISAFIPTRIRLRPSPGFMSGAWTVACEMITQFVVRDTRSRYRLADLVSWMAAAPT